MDVLMTLRFYDLDVSFALVLLCFHNRFGHLSAHASWQGDIDRLAFVLPSVVVHCPALFVLNGSTFLIESAKDL